MPIVVCVRAYVRQCLYNMPKPIRYSHIEQCVGHECFLHAGVGVEI